MNARLSKFLPPSLGTLFGQPAATDQTWSQPKSTPEYGAIPGALKAPELCQLVEDYRADLLPWQAEAEVKVDGIRTLYIAGQLVTREASPMECAHHALPILRDLEQAYGRPMFFDGEYVEDGGLEATIAAFRRRQGNGCLWLFDAVPFDQWQSGRPSDQPLHQRKAELRAKLEQVGALRDGMPVGFVNGLKILGASHEGRVAYVRKMAGDLWEQGYEGLVIKLATSRYVRKRACDWMKVKAVMVSKMVVVDVCGCTRAGVETMKYMLLRLPGHPPSQTIKVMTYGGMAETLWTHRGSIIGTEIDVEHAGFTGAGNPREAKIKRVAI